MEAALDAEDPARDHEAAGSGAANYDAPGPDDPPPEDADLVPIEVTWGGISPLYKQYLSDREAMTELSRRLAPWIAAPAQLHVRYDSENFVGDIRLMVPPKGWAVAPGVGEQRVDLQSLAPVTRALAVYRDAIANRYDVRVQSFRIGIDLFRGASHCEILPAGSPPPDGTLVSPCVKLNSQDVCGWPEAGGVRFTEADWGDLKRCFRD